MENDMKDVKEDLQLLKGALTEIRVAINLEPELKENIKQQVQEARERISNGEFISNEEMLREFDIE